MRSFQEALSRCSLSDLGWSDDILTWSNRRFKRRLIKERLDRFVNNFEWWHRFWGSVATNIISIRLNHTIILIDIMGPKNNFGKRKNKGFSRFHFEEIWAEHDDCKAIIKNS